MPITIAIDGPAGAGKSTVARRVAGHLGFTYIDTGAMYRALAWKALRDGVSLEEERALETLARSTTLELSPLDNEHKQKVWADGEEVTAVIRTPQVTSATSVLSAFPAVRRRVVEQQQALGRTAKRGVVLEGRDIGTVVFPDAEVKIFLTASSQERARRRYEQLQALGMEADYAQVLADQMERDTRDSQRADSPLVAAPDAFHLNTDGLTIEDVVNAILQRHDRHLSGEAGKDG